MVLTSQCGKRWPLPTGRTGVLSGTCTTGRRGIGDCCGAGRIGIGTSVSSFLSAYSWLHPDPAPSVCPGAPSAVGAALVTVLGFGTRNFAQGDWYRCIRVTTQNGTDEILLTAASSFPGGLGMSIQMEGSSSLDVSANGKETLATSRRWDCVWPGVVR